MNKLLRWKHGRVRGWTIDGKGNLLCEYDPDYLPTYRVRGYKRKYYRQVQVMIHGRLQWFYVHRLMAFSWLTKPRNPLKRIVDHRNGDSLCNDIQNLRWVTVTGNNLNKKCYGLEESVGMFYPRVAGHTHWKYGSCNAEDAKETRKLLVECYVRYNNRFPNCGSEWPHESIFRY